MDPRRFDSFTQSLAAAKTRRGLLGGIAALVAGVRAAEQASATLDCPPGQTRNRKGQCLCLPGTNACSTGCYNLRSDPNNCGTCGNVCLSGEECRKGACFCPSGATCFEPVPCTTSADCPTDFFCLSGFCTPSSGPGFVFNAPAAAVWRALTDAETLTSLGISSNIAPVVGHRFQFFPAPGADPATTIEAEMIEVDEPRRFAFTMLTSDLDEPTTVTVTLDVVEGGSATRFRLAQTDASGKSCLASARVLGRHWGQRFFKEALPRHLAQKQ